MASLADLSIRRPVATAMFYLVIITIGVMGLRFLPVDLLPAMEFPQLSIITSYSNVGPEEMEQLVTHPIENSVAGVPNIERVNSRSSEGSSFVRLEFTQGTNINEAANDVRDALDRVRNSLPPEADPPRIRKFNPDDISIITVAVSSNRDLESLTRIIDTDLTRQFEQIPGVGAIELRGGIFREINVDLRRDRLRQAGLTGQEVMQAISQESAISPGGNVKDGLQDLYVRTLGEFTSVDQIAQVVVNYEDGVPIRVQDVATVSSDYEDVSRLVEVDGEPMIQFQVRKQTGANTVAVADNVRAQVEEINQTRSDVHLTVVSDQSTFIQQSIDSVQNAAIWGAFLAILVLYYFFRNGSSTFIIALSIPISMIATFGLLFFSDLSLNQMTFGGLALGIGLIVDNAIVVLENIIRHREENSAKLKKAASVGTSEVIGAIIASTLTTSVIFLPIFFMQSTIGLLFRELAIVVVFALVCSLLVAITLVPMLASRMLTTKKGGRKEDDRSFKFQERFDRFERWYSGKLSTAVSKRYWVFGAAGVLVGGALLLFPLVPVELAPETDANEIRVDLRMDDGINLAVVQSYLQELEEQVRQVVPQSEVLNMSTQIWRGRGRIDITLPEPGARTVDSHLLADEIREAITGSVPGADIRVRAQAGLWVLRVLFSGGGGDGDEAVQVELRGHDVEAAQMWARRVADRMHRVEGVSDVEVGGEDDVGQPEQNIILDRDRIATLGLSTQAVGQAVQIGVGGGTAGYFREHGQEYPIRVRFRPEDRLTVMDLENIAVRTPDGGTVPISAVTRQQRSRSMDSINRIDGQRVTYISANLERGVALGTAVSDIREELRTLDLPDEFSIVFGGEYQEQQEAQRDFVLAILMALALIYMVMAGQFERFIDPLIVMFSVPLALVGVIPTLWLTGTTMNMQSVMGLIMLIGIVVNNAIVLVDYINLIRREQGLDLTDAVVEAGRLRLRPILMTTVTTVLALFPLALGWGAGAEMQAALARTVIGGLTASTLITLVLIPVVYVSVHQVKAYVLAKIGEFRGGRAGTTVSPATT